MKKQSILFKINLVVIPTVLIALILLTTISYFSTKSIINSQTEMNMQSKLSSNSEMAQKLLLNNARVVETLAKTVESSYGVLGKDNYISLLEKFPQTNSETCGVGVWFQPYKYDESMKYFGPYAYKDNGKVVYTDDYSKPEYNYPSQEWYKLGLNVDKAVDWSEPYVDPVTKVSMITASSHFVDGGNNIVGVTTADMDLTSLQKNISSVKIGDTGETFLISKKSGIYVASKDKSRIMKKKIQNESNKSLASIGKSMISGKSGKGTYKDNGITYNVYYTAVPNSNMVLGIQISQNELFKSADSLMVKYIIITAVFIILTALVIIYSVNKIRKRLNSAVGHLNVISEGNLTQKVPKKFLNLNDEAGDVSRAVHNMQEELRVLLLDTKDSIHKIIDYTKKLKSISGDMSSNSEGVATAIEEIAKGINSQSGELIEVSNNINEFGEAIDNVVQEIEKIDDSSSYINARATDSNDKMQLLIQSIEGIGKLSYSFEKQLKGFADRIKEVNEITLLIDSISDQTNLLALNAAIEAERAGEAGKGFAVVADEIRKLAEQSKNSSENIRDVIGNISANMGDIFSMSKNINDEIIKQTDVVNTASDSYETIIDEIGKIVPKIQSINNLVVKIDQKEKDISSKIETISATAEEISASSEEITASSKETEESSREVSKAAETLEDMTKDMTDNINNFKL